MIVEIVQDWLACRDGLLKAIERTGGTHNEDDVLFMLFQGKLKLLRHGESGLVVEVMASPRMNILHVFLAGGKMDEILHLEKTLPDLAKTLGCQRITLAGRSGWERALKDHGWGEKVIYLQKDLP